MTLEEYLQYQNEQSMDQYWQDKFNEQSDVGRETKDEDGELVNLETEKRKVYSEVILLKLDHKDLQN